MSPEAVFVADAAANVTIHHKPHKLWTRTTKNQTPRAKDSLHKRHPTEHDDDADLETTFF